MSNDSSGFFPELKQRTLLSFKHGEGRKTKRLKCRVFRRFKPYSTVLLPHLNHEQHTFTLATSLVKQQASLKLPNLPTECFTLIPQNRMMTTMWSPSDKFNKVVTYVLGAYHAIKKREKKKQTRNIL